MDQRLKHAALAGAATLTIVASLTACSRPAPQPAHTAAAASTSSPATVIPTAAVLDAPPNETLLGQLTSQQGTNELGPYPVTTSTIAVYAVCRGSGIVKVTVVGIGEFPVSCGAKAGGGVRNAFDARFVKSFSVRGQGDDSLTWGLAVTAIPDPH